MIGLISFSIASSYFSITAKVGIIQTYREKGTLSPRAAHSELSPMNPGFDDGHHVPLRSVGDWFAYL